MSSNEASGESLLFRAGSHLCALSVAHVVETMRPLPVEEVAGSPSCVRGIAMIRGVPVPVVDVARLLGADASPEIAGDARLAARFVTLRVAGRVVALAVNGVVGVRDLPPATVGDLPPLLRDAGTEVIAAVGRLDAELLFVLRSARLLSFGLGAPSPASPPSGEEPA